MQAAAELLDSSRCRTKCASCPHTVRPTCCRIRLPAARARGWSVIAGAGRRAPARHDRRQDQPAVLGVPVQSRSWGDSIRCCRSVQYAGGVPVAGRSRSALPARPTQRLCAAAILGNRHPLSPRRWKRIANARRRRLGIRIARDAAHMTVGIVGAGQLGRMLALAGYPLGLDFLCLDRRARRPRAGRPAAARRLHDHRLLTRLARRCEVLTFDWENVAVGACVRGACARRAYLSADRGARRGQDRVARSACSSG